MAVWISFRTQNARRARRDQAVERARGESRRAHRARRRPRGRPATATARARGARELARACPRALAPRAARAERTRRLVAVRATGAGRIPPRRSREPAQAAPLAAVHRLHRGRGRAALAPPSPPPARGAPSAALGVAATRRHLRRGRAGRRGGPAPAGRGGWVFGRRRTRGDARGAVAAAATPTAATASPTRTISASTRARPARGSRVARQTTTATAAATARRVRARARARAARGSISRFRRSVRFSLVCPRPRAARRAVRKDLDRDNDGVPDARRVRARAARLLLVGRDRPDGDGCEDALEDADDDGDGVPDDDDECARTEGAAAAGARGCSARQRGERTRAGAPRARGARACGSSRPRSACSSAARSQDARLARPRAPRRRAAGASAEPRDGARRAARRAARRRRLGREPSRPEAGRAAAPSPLSRMLTDLLRNERNPFMFRHPTSACATRRAALLRRELRGAHGREHALLSRACSTTCSACLVHSGARRRGLLPAKRAEQDKKDKAAARR